MVPPMHRARPRARTPRTLQASESTNHLPAESRRKPDTSTASNMRATRLPPGTRRGKAPPWVGNGRRRLGDEEGRGWQPPLGHGPGGGAQVLLLADAARECTWLADAAGTMGLRETHTRHPGAGGSWGLHGGLWKTLTTHTGARRLWTMHRRRRMLWRWLRSNHGVLRGAEQRGVPANLRDVTPGPPRGDT